MKTIALLAVASLALVGCNKQNDMGDSADAQKDQIEQSKDAQKEALNQEKRGVEQASDQAKADISAQAKAEKERVESQAEAEKAQIEAQKKQVEAQAAAAKAQAEAQQKINEAAGAATSPADASVTADIQPASEADRTLTTQVRESLTSQNPSLASVQISAMNGKITLRGTVKTEEEKKNLEAQAKAVSGVSSVDNKLEVKAE